MSLISQNLDSNYDRLYKRKDAQCIFLVEKGTLNKMKKLAMEKRFESMSHMIRTIVIDYVEKEMKKGQ